MKKLSFLLLMMLAVLQVNAQQSSRPGKELENTIARKLGVSASKAAAIADALLSDPHGIRLSLADSSLDRGTRDEKLKRLREERRRRLLTLLTPAQISLLGSQASRELVMSRRAEHQKAAEEQVEKLKPGKRPAPSTTNQTAVKP